MPSAWGVLYLFGLADGRIKVGRSIRAKQRLAKHRCDHGRALVWAHVFLQPNSGGAEYAAICALSWAGARAGRTEMFAGLTKRQAIEICRAVIHRPSMNKQQVLAVATAGQEA